jgi:hypothetical protein
MPFNHVAQPEQLKNLAQAFDLAWPKVVQVCRIRNEDQAILLRERVANYILACSASQWEFDPEKLSQKAIRAFRQSSCGPLPQEACRDNRGLVS